MEEKKTKKKKKYTVKHHRLHKFVWGAARIFLPPHYRKKYGYTCNKMPETETPYIVVSNHTMELDPIICGMSVGKHMYYICGEHLMTGKAWKSLSLFFSPIPKYKGDIDIAPILEALRRIRAGYNILLYPEGSRSFNGETEPVSTAIGSFIRTAKCGLVTFRSHGGYFTEPRWAYTARVGKIGGTIQNVFSKEEVAKMTPAEITEIVNRDLHENAYERQRKDMIPYRGERLAEGLDNYLILCPVCGGLDTMETKDDKFSCTCCGTGGRYTEYGFLEGEGLRYDSVYDWGVWEKQAFNEKYADVAPDEKLFSDDDVVLKEIAPDHTRVEKAKGTLTAYADRMEIGEETFLFSDITGMDMLYYGKTLVFTVGRRHLNITGERYHAIKYNWLYNLYSKKNG